MIHAKLGCCPSRDVAMETIFFSFWTFSQTKLLSNDAMCYASWLRNSFRHAISKTLEIGIRFSCNNKNVFISSIEWHRFNKVRWPTDTYVYHFLPRDAMLTRYRPILCYGPLFIRPSVWLAAEGPCDANVLTSNSAFFIFAVLVVWFSHSRPYKMF